MNVSALLTAGLVSGPGILRPDVTVCVEGEHVGVVEEVEELIAMVEETCQNEVIAEFVIDAFAATGSPVAIGTTVAAQAFTAAFNRAPSAALLSNDNTPAVEDVAGTPTAFASGESHRLTAPGSVAWTLTASEGGGSDAAIAARVWRAPIYLGWTVDPGPYTFADILALSELTSPLSPDGDFNVSLNPVNAYLVAAYHDEYNGAADTDFSIGGFFPGGASEIQTSVNFDLPEGGTAPYSIARSDAIQNYSGLIWRRS